MAAEGENSSNEPLLRHASAHGNSSAQAVGHVCSSLTMHLIYARSAVDVPEDLPLAVGRDDTDTDSESSLRHGATLLQGTFNLVSVNNIAMIIQIQASQL